LRAENLKENKEDPIDI